ncbi:hypothetical protein ACFX2C_017084 [Malus domestica]
MIGSAWAEEVAWHGQLFGLPRLGCLPKMRKLLKFDFSTAMDGAAKIGATKDKVSDKQIIECKNGCYPLTICCLVDLQAFDLFELCGFLALESFTQMGVRELVYHIALENN